MKIAMKAPLTVRSAILQPRNVTFGLSLSFGPDLAHFVKLGRSEMFIIKN
jgi:hypothetical protein